MDYKEELSIGKFMIQIIMAIVIAVIVTYMLKKGF